LDAVGLNNAAVRLTLEHRYTEAQAFLERAIEAEPTAAKFHRNLSALFERMKKFDEALAAARTAAKLAPADPSVLDLLCGLEFVSGNTAAAIGCYERFQSIEPLDVVSQTYYGLALFRSGKSSESITILEQAARSTPPAADALHALGVVYFKTKRYDEAAATLKNAVEAAPDANEIRYNLAIAELARRNRAAATSQYNIIKAADPELAGKLYRMLHGDKVLFVGDRQNPK
jgi:tetratricopeptide (TPR) repeat protein